MGLLVKNVGMICYRNFPIRDINLSDGMTILCGRNATGKTNTVEALQMLTAGTSFRHPRAKDMILEGEGQARISSRLEGDGRVVDVACEITPTSRRFTRNGKPCRPADLSATLMSVLFCPDDLSFVKQGAKYRREELDGFGEQANGGYRKVAGAYARSIEQRNRLLKDPRPDLALLDAWDASVALGGATLLEARLRLFRRLRDHLVEVYGHVSDVDRLDARYVCTLGDDVEGKSRDELATIFADRLAASRAEDLRRQQTTCGPQRDDVVFTLDGRDARSFGSQGQQRSIVLAWKMAEVALSAEICGEQPLLLLDDVMSELDATRRDAITRFVQGGIQTVVTTTNLGYFPQELLDQSEVVTFGE